MSALDEKESLRALLAEVDRRYPQSDDRPEIPPSKMSDAYLLELLADETSELLRSSVDKADAWDAVVKRGATSTAQSERERVLESALERIEPLAMKLNSYAAINEEWGRVVEGQAQASRDLYAIVAALKAAP